MNHHQLPISETYKLLNTSKQGLPAAEAEERQKQYGKNELTEKKKVSVFVLFLKQFKDVMVIILLLAAAISFAVGDLKDAIVILIIVLLNAHALVRVRTKQEGDMFQGGSLGHEPLFR